MKQNTLWQVIMPALLLLSEYDSDSSDNEDSSTNGEDAVEGVPVKVLSRSVLMPTGRPIMLSYRALSSY